MSSNPWKAFQELMSGQRKWVGVIMSMALASGQASVAIHGTTTLIVVSGASNSYAVGDFVFIEGKVIVSKAPSYRQTSLESVL